MTPANKRKFKELAKRLDDAAEQNLKSETALYIILDAIERLTRIASDFHFRPEANDEG